MTPGRLDDLLERALSEGAVPADATPEERAELEPLLAASGRLRLDAARVAAEADAVMPTARARFQRHLAEQRAPAVSPPIARARRGWLGGFFGGRGLAFSASVAALAVVAVLAVLVVQPFSSVETAAALEVDDYVQVQGVVSSTEGGTVTVQSAELGNLQVAVSEQTSVVDDDGVREPASLKPGDPVLVSGIVLTRKSIAATTVAVGDNQGLPTPVPDKPVPLLKKFRPLEGTITVLALSPDGANARILINAGQQRFLVDVERRSVDALLASSPSALGLRVRLVDSPELPEGLFRLEPLGARPEPPATAPQFQNVRGTIVARTANVLTVRTDRGLVPVVITRSTSLRLGESGLTIQDIREGERAIGHPVSVSGGLEAEGSRRIIASVIVLLPKPSQ